MDIFFRHGFSPFSEQQNAPWLPIIARRTAGRKVHQGAFAHKGIMALSF